MKFCGNTFLMAAASALAAAFLASCATIGGAGASFSDADKNGDGKLGKSERMNDCRKEFAEMDANKDGKVSKEEYYATKSEEFSKYDTNKDEHVVLEEIIIVPKGVDLDKARETKEKMGKEKEAALASMDIDGDKMVTPEEYVVHHMILIEKCDTDKDGRVSREEYLKYYMDRFEKADKTKDGTLSPEEYLLERGVISISAPPKPAAYKGIKKEDMIH